MLRLNARRLIYRNTRHNLEKPAMPFRMSRTLRFWVEVETEYQDLRKADDKEVVAILREFEQCGDAMRSLNRRGQIVWKASPQMLDRLADAEAEVEAEYQNER
jgi:hypothetical protein